MKRIITICLMMTLCMGAAFAQTKKPAVTKPQPATQGATTQGQPQTQQQPNTQPFANLLGEHFGRKYAIASRWNDFDVAKDAMYDLIVEYPGSDSLIFALAYFYYENQKYPSAALVCQDLLARNPKNEAALEVAANSYEALNIFDRALQSYESLFLITNNATTLYKMAYLQFETKRYPEVLTNADILLTKPEVDSLKVVFNDTQNKPKEYPMKVAIINLKGMAARDSGDKDNARKFFEEALKAAPDFLPAKQNLAALK